MCLCLFSINEHDEFPFILLANRDEFRKRPAAKANFWTDKPNVLAGRDLEGMGTWLGTNKSGSIAFLTNYRHPDYFNRKGPTRGTLVSDFLAQKNDPEVYLNAIHNPDDYNGFNLVIGNAKQLFYYSNVEGKIQRLEAGTHGLSNAFLNTSWPKVDDGKRKLNEAVKTNNLSSDNLFSILYDGNFANDKDLPKTGVSSELERILSAKFINTKEYGTVCSTVAKINQEGKCLFEERTFDSNGSVIDKVKYEFQITVD